MKKSAGRPPQVIDPVIGTRIRSSRNAIPGLTQENLAEKLKVSPVSIRNWENSRSTPGARERYEALAKHLNVSMAYLMNMEGQENEALSDNFKSIAKFGLMLGSEPLPVVTEYLNKLAGGRSRALLDKHLKDDFDYLTHVIKQNIDLMDPDLDEDVFLFKSIKNAHENFKYLKKRQNKINQQLKKDKRGAL